MCGAVAGEGIVDAILKQPSAPATAGDTEARYWAFISYSHKDEKWARWLQKRLERVRIPSDLAPKVPGLLNPRRISPIFRDTDELGASSDLTSSIKHSLSESYYLIVICSPDAARSQWVNAEIEYFIELGRKQRILLVVVAGESRIPQPTALVTKRDVGHAFVGGRETTRGLAGACHSPRGGRAVERCFRCALEEREETAAAENCDGWSTVDTCPGDCSLPRLPLDETN